MGNRKLGLNMLYLASLAAWAGMNGIGFSATAAREPVSVVHCPDQSVSLEARWQWALTQIPAGPGAEQVWIGFSTPRLMPENSFIGRWPVSPDYPTLSELVYGVRVELPRFSYSRRQAPREVTKEVAYLFEVERASGRIEQAQTSDILLSVPAMRGVLYWLGQVSGEQAAPLFQSLYRQAQEDELRVRLVAQMAEAQNERTLAFLQEVLQKDRSDHVRRAAVHELEAFVSQRTLELLLGTVRQDPSDTVRREAVRTISRLELPTVENALMELAQAGPSPSVQREAIRALGQRASSAVIACLGNIADRDKDETLQRQALEALAQVGLSNRAYHRPAELSGGERQRTTIARALVNRPALVWGDEPTGDLDSETAHEIMDVLVNLNQEKQLTFILVTHDRGVGARCERIVRMRDGLVVNQPGETVQVQ